MVYGGIDMDNRIILCSFLSDSKGSIYIVHVLSFVALIMQYTGFNYSLFKDFPFEVKFPLGRIAEMMPYATIGYDFSRFDLLERMRTTSRRKWYMWTALIMTIVLLLLGKRAKDFWIWLCGTI